jgi:hypothetical protein
MPEMLEKELPSPWKQFLINDYQELLYKYLSSHTPLEG